MTTATLDPELSGWVRDFTHERHRVTAEDIRREFFPDEVGTPYLYLDQLTAEGYLLVVPSEDAPTSWIVGTEEKPNLALSRVGLSGS